MNQRHLHKVNSTPLLHIYTVDLSILGTHWSMQTEFKRRHLAGSLNAYNTTILAGCCKVVFFNSYYINWILQKSAISFQKHYPVHLMEHDPKATFASKYNDPCRKYLAFIYKLQWAFLFLLRMVFFKEKEAPSSKRWWTTGFILFG